MQNQAPLIDRRLIDGQPVFTLDGLFPPDLVRLIHETCRQLPFTLSDYDTDASPDIRHWKYEFEPLAFAAHPLFRRWHDVVVARTRALFDGQALELQRVHVNKHPCGDLQLPHRDIVPGVTAVYFANHDWRDEWQGELVFYDGASEPCYAVSPKPGRLVVFSADILHRGGVPSRACSEPRLSVAFKFSSAS